MEALLASVVLPAIIDLFKTGATAASRKFIGLSVDDQIKLENAGVEKLKALSGLDNPHGTPSQWVIDLRGSFRYIAAMVVMLAGLYAMWKGSPLAQELIAMPFGFIFGERLWAGLKGPNNK